MKIAVMQPYVFPYIGYFQLIYASDLFVLYNDVNWINRGWINRNRILLDGEPFTLSIPCKKTSQNKLICETEIKLEEKTISKLLKMIKISYKKAPFFSDVYKIIIEVFEESIRLKTIDELAAKSINSILIYLNIERYIKNSAENYPETRGLTKADRLIAICKKENADTYINAAGGQEIYDKEFFQNQNISLNFLKSKNIKYKQFNDLFIPWLSIIDILMFNSVEEIHQFLHEYELS